jgi:cephalosporin-C deacetylase-like acetyl esterase
MKHTRFHAVLVCLAVLVWASSAAAKDVSTQKLSVRSEKASGVYAMGEPIRWRVECTGDQPADGVDYTLQRGELAMLREGKLKLNDGVTVVTARLNGPGTLLLEVKSVDANGREHKVLGGAVVAPAAIQPSSPPPVDFRAFWDAKLRELAEVPVNARLEQADSGRDGVDYWRITMDNVHGRHIRGQLARPTTGEKLPALLIPQWAGVYPLEKPWATDRAAEGWLVLNIMAHDLPIDEPAEFYQEQYDGPLKNYWAIGNDDRDKSYFLPMYLACYRAADYLTSRPDWDGRTLVVCGTSQGGQQTLVTAGLHPRVTAALALVPAGCDMLGPEVGRKGGWPQWYDLTVGKDPKKVHETSRYFDAVNFAAQIKCPLLIGLGLIDQTCPPAGVLAAANQVDAPKEVVILPVSGHQNENDSQQPFYDRCYGAWLPALREGKPAPVNQP